MGIPFKMRKAVFFDRDGVLNHSILINGVSCPPANAREMEFTPGARECIAHLKTMNYLCICATNQPDFSRGMRTRANIDSMNRKTLVRLNLDDLYVCLHDNHHRCHCRKPRPGLLLMAAEQWNIDLTQSWMIGDRETDIGAGRGAGCHTILLTTNNAQPAETRADYICSSLDEIPGIIKGNSIIAPMRPEQHMEA